MFSLGCNGISGFEEDVKSRYPHCTIHVYDPTVSEGTAAKVADRIQARTAHRLAVFHQIEMMQVHLRRLTGCVCSTKLARHLTS